MAVLGSPGPFKARKKDPERMLADFNLYVKSIKNLLTLTENTNSTDVKKKALMQSVGGPDMIWLFEYVGKVEDGDTYAAAIEKSESGHHRANKPSSDEIHAVHRNGPRGTSFFQLVDQHKRTGGQV